MITEKSCGAVVFTVKDNQIKYVIIENRRGTYGFPKGHVEGNETEIETALREIKEETNLDVTLIDGFRTTDEYFLPRKEKTLKTVVYFLGEYSDQEIKAQQSEVTSFKLATFEEALSIFDFPNQKRIITEANEFLLKYLANK